MEPDIQRVVVVDAKGKLQGLISDCDLLRYFNSEQEDIWHLLAKATLPFKQNLCRADLQQYFAEITAGAVMTTELAIASEKMLIEEAIAMMIDKELTTCGRCRWPIKGHD